MQNKCLNMEEMQAAGMLLGGMNQDKLVFPSSFIQNCHMLTTGMNNGHNNNVGSEMKNVNSKSMRQKVYIYISFLYIKISSLNIVLIVSWFWVWRILRLWGSQDHH